MAQSAPGSTSVQLKAILSISPKAIAFAAGTPAGAAEVFEFVASAFHSPGPAPVPSKLTPAIKVGAPTVPQNAIT